MMIHRFRVSLLLVPFLLVGCSWEQNTPTDPGGLSMRAEVSADALRLGDDASAELRSLAERCEAGAASACNQVAHSILESGGDHAQARELLLAACAVSYAGSCLRAAELPGVAAEEREELTERACELGLMQGCVALAALRGGAESEEGRALLVRACEAGHVGACEAQGPLSARRSDPPAPPRPSAPVEVVEEEVDGEESAEESEDGSGDGAP